MTINSAEYSSQHQGSVVAVFPGFPGVQTFAGMTAVQSGITLQDFWDGGFQEAGVKGSAVTHGEATLRRVWNRSRDMQLIRFLRPRLSNEYQFSVSKQPTTANLVADGPAFGYTVMLMNLSDPEVSQGNQSAMQEFTLSVRVLRVTQ